MPDVEPIRIPLPTGTIDAVAKAIYEVPFEWEGEEFARVWDQAPSDVRDRLRDRARAAISAYEQAKSKGQR